MTDIISMHLDSPTEAYSPKIGDATNCRNQNTLFENEDALKCLHNNRKWLLSKNLSIKKLSRNLFPVPKKIESSTQSTEINTRDLQKETVCQENEAQTLSIPENFTNNKIETNIINEKLANELKKWQESKNRTEEITKHSKFLSNVDHQNCLAPVDIANNPIFEKIQVDKYNNWKQMTIHNKNEMSLEHIAKQKELRKNDIMQQLENLR